MSFLLDTHAFIWFLNGDDALPKAATNKIKNIKNQCFISIASIWEIAIKIKLNKLALASDFNKILLFLEDNHIEILPISFEHILKLNGLDFHHRDPFDRLIIAQALSEKLTVISKDENFKFYKVKLFWK